MNKTLHTDAPRESVKLERNWVSQLLRRNDVSVVLATVLLFIIFSVTTESFLSSYNMFNVFRTTALYLFVALGQAIVLVVGGMNLSLGAIGGLSVVAAGYAMHTLGLPGWAAVLLSLAVGALAGFANGFVIIRLKLNAFVVTLASSFIYTGLVLGISKGFPYTNIPKDFTFIGREGIFGVPYLLWLGIVMLVILAYMFKYTVIGRHILATGGNLVAARMSGIKTDQIIMLVNVLSGIFAALAGVLWVSRMGSATPATGSDWMIISFAVAVIGGTALSGGLISSIGLLASSFMIVLIKNGLIMLGVNVYFEQTFLGMIIMLAVAMESLRMKYSAAKRI